MESPRDEREKRAQNRRRQKGKGEGSRDESRDPKKGPSPSKKKRSRRRNRGGKSNSAAAVLSQEPKKIDLTEDTEIPLSEQEVATLREHFRFLQENRKQLRLKVNAAEDLLLNGVREPTHRGVCQHLLNKLDRSSVISATERLDPHEAAELLSGVIRFAADIEFILLYLEKIRLTASQKDATAALSQGLPRIDFSKVTSTQMRRVLDLIAELFDEKQRPHLLLALLESKSFRDAVDEAIEHLPESLAQLIVPLRAAQATILQGAHNTYGADPLITGVRYLFDAPDNLLLRYEPPVRQRLICFGVQACSPPKHALHQSLNRLLESFPKAGRPYSELGMTLARHLLASGEEGAASTLLNQIKNAHPKFHLPGRWLEILATKRIDRFSLEAQPSDRTDAIKHHRWRAAVCLTTMRPVWIQVCTSEHAQSHQASEALLGELGLPHVVSLLTSGTTPEGEAYFAIPNPGQGLPHALDHKGGLSLASTTRVCRDAALLLSALATAGVELGDVNLERFAIDRNEQLWLIDLSGAQKTSVEAAKRTNFDCAQQFCREVFQHAGRFIPPPDVIQAVDEAQDCVALARALANSPALS